MHIREDDGERPWHEVGVYEVAPGVHRIPLPMPHDHLRAVNVYALADGDGLTLIDSGVAAPASRAYLDDALETLGCGLHDVKRFIVTHIHYDHYSQAIAVRDEVGTPVALGHNEEPSILRLLESPGKAIAQQLELLHFHGAGELVEGVIRARSRREPPTTGLPDQWLDDETDVVVGDRLLTTLHTPGHTQGHVVFLDRHSNLLFAGDHILPHITPSLGFEPEQAALPLRDYLESLRRVREIPDSRLLPAHGHVGPSAHQRIDELLEHHYVRLASSFAVASPGATAFDVARQLQWTRRERSLKELDPVNQMLAVLETAAHLDLLVVQGRLVRILSDDTAHYVGAAEPE